MTARVRPGVGQEVLPEVLEAAPHVPNFAAQNAFCRAATPEYWGMDPAAYADVAVFADRASADNFRVNLINVKSSSKFAVDYELESEPRRLARHRVALTPEEYRLITRSANPRNLGDVAAAATYVGLALDPHPERVADRAEENEVTAVLGKMVSMSKYLDQTLEPEKALLDWLIEAVDHHWWARGNEAGMREKLTTVLGVTVPNMLRVVGIQRAWTREQMKLASRTLDYRLFFMRKNNGHIGNWRETLVLLRDYDQAKIDAFGDRVGKAKGYLVQSGHLAQ